MLTCSALSSFRYDYAPLLQSPPFCPSIHRSVTPFLNQHQASIGLLGQVYSTSYWWITWDIRFIQNQNILFSRPKIPQRQLCQRPAFDQRLDAKYGDNFPYESHVTHNVEVIEVVKVQNKDFRRVSTRPISYFQLLPKEFEVVKSYRNRDVP